MRKFKFFLFIQIILGIILLSISQGILDAAGKSQSAAQYNWINKKGVYLPCVLYYFGTPTPTPTQIMLPDLTVPFAGVGFYGCPFDQPGNISALISNIGPGDAGFFLVDIIGTDFPVTELNANNYIEITAEIDPGPLGMLWVYADSEQDVPESDETNNQFELKYTPPLYCTSSPTPTPTQTGY